MDFERESIIGKKRKRVFFQFILVGDRPSHQSRRILDVTITVKVIDRYTK